MLGSFIIVSINGSKNPSASAAPGAPGEPFVGKDAGQTEHDDNNAGDDSDGSWEEVTETEDESESDEEEAPKKKKKTGK